MLQPLLCLLVTSILDEKSSYAFDKDPKTLNEVLQGN